MHNFYFRKLRIIWCGVLLVEIHFISYLVLTPATWTLALQITISFVSSRLVSSRPWWVWTLVIPAAYTWLSNWESLQLIWLCTRLSALINYLLRLCAPNFRTTPKTIFNIYVLLIDQFSWDITSPEIWYDFSTYPHTYEFPIYIRK